MFGSDQNNKLNKHRLGAKKNLDPINSNKATADSLLDLVLSCGVGLGALSLSLQESLDSMLDWQVAESTWHPKLQPRS